jgi:hypothetical protein
MCTTGVLSRRDQLYEVDFSYEKLFTQGRAKQRRCESSRMGELYLH